MAVIRLLLVVSVIVCAYAAPKPKTVIDGITKYFDTEGKIAGHGYYSETHHVVTTDGYILEINRIPYGKKGSQTNFQKPVVFLMHGLQGSALSYITMGPEHSMAYHLADSGFDVWMGNARGVFNSRNHVSLNPDDDKDKQKFFDYSFEEIAVIDLPTMIDYVLENTGREKLHYIGHSQGGTVFLILTSMLPEYNEKFASVDLLAGVGYQRNFPSPAIAALAATTDIIYAFASRLGSVELFGPGWEENQACGENDGSGSCSLVDIMDVIGDLSDGHIIAGSALKQFALYGQNIRDKSFRRWNYGLFNLANYGSMSPPAYDLGLITTKVVMHYTVNDDLLSEEDVLAMAADMPNASVRKVARETFTHTEFTTAIDAKELVTDYIIERIKKLLSEM